MPPDTRNERAPVAANGRGARKCELVKPRAQSTALHAEQALLGALLMGGTRPPAGLQPQHFDRTDHRSIYAVILAAVAEGAPADAVTVAELMEADGTLHDAGGMPYLVELANSTPGPVGIERWAQSIREAHRRRRATEIGAELVAGADPADAAARLQALSAQSRSVWTPAATDRFDVAELERDPPPILFAVHPYLPAGTAIVLTGAGGTSKTGLMTMIAVALCSGMSVLGDDEIAPGAVLYITAEDRRDLLQRHVWAAVQGLPHAALRAVSERLHVKDVVGSGFTLTQAVTGTAQIAAEVAELAAYAKTITNLRLVILDTLSRLNGGDEMNEHLAAFVRGMERIAVETGAAVLVAHHTGKAQMREGTSDQYAGRGGSALSDNCRSALHLDVVKDGPTAPSNADEQMLADERLLLLRHVKSNYATKAPDRYLERRRTEYAARLVEFEADLRPKASEPVSKTWAIVADWLRSQTIHDHPTKAIIEAELRGQAARSDLRQALAWGEDCGLVDQLPHPSPKAGRKTYYALPEASE